MNWSPFQEAIFDAVSNSPRNLQIEAVAGSGKTTTICEAMRHTTASKPLFVAFNKSIALAIESKIPDYATARTLNALGHAALMQYSLIGKNAKFDQWKVRNIARSLGCTNPEWQAEVASAVGFAKNTALGIVEAASVDWFHDFINLHSLVVDPLDTHKVASYAFRTFQQSLNCDELFDFDDQVYQPILREVNPYRRFDCIFVDEAQDLSPINHLALKYAYDEGSRIIAVGDRRQAIYAFRGADSSSMNSMQSMFNMSELPLSVTYRCPEEVVALAKRHCPQITARAGASKGSISEVDSLPEVAAFLDDDLILCRNNAPLFGIALEFIKAKRPCQLMTNLAKDVLKIIQHLDGSTAGEALSDLKKWRDEQLAKYEPGDRRSSDIWDRYRCIEPFFSANQLGSKYTVIEAIRGAIDSKRGTRISTIHRAKGFEASNVYFEQPELLGDEGQEMNLHYVAITRSAENLFFHQIADTEEYYPGEE